MTEQPQMLESALNYARKGWAVFPLGVKSKQPMISRREGGRGCSDATTDEDQIIKWWTRWPQANIGVNVGMSGFLAIDVDPRSGGSDTWHELKTTYGLNDETVTNLSGRGDGGFHLLYATNGADVSRFETSLGEGVDVKRGNSYIIVEPSIHPDSKKPYQWDVGYHPDDMELVGIPPSLNLLLSRNGTGRSRRRKGTRPPRGRDAHSDISNYLDSKGYEYTKSENPDFTFYVMKGGCITGEHADNGGYGFQVFENGNAIYKCHHATCTKHDKRGAYDVMSLMDLYIHDDILYTDMGNSTRFANAHSDKVKYTQSLGWLVWAGSHWQQDETGAPFRLARKVTSQILKEAENHHDQDMAEKIFSWGIRSQERSRLSAIVDLARSERSIVRLTHQFDKEPWLLNCKNGTLDLKTGELKPHSQDDLLTCYTPVEYDKNAKCPTWDKFLNEIFQEDQALITYVQKAIGYSLTGSTIEQCLFFLYGCGSNGKTTMTQAVFGNVLSNYTKKTNVQTILHRDRAYINNDIARLRGARAVLVSEIPEGRRLNEPLVKDLTGNDVITARFLNKEFFEFLPTFKLWMYGNHKPVIRGTDLGIWRRLRLVPFNVTFSDDEKDETLPDKLARETSGILTWAVQGCFLWQGEGLDSPKAVAEATKEYRSDMDVIGVFLAESTKSGMNFSVKFSHLYAAYDQWCEASNERKESKRKFGERIRERGIEAKEGTGNILYVHGVGLIDSLASEREQRS